MIVKRGQRMTTFGVCAYTYILFSFNINNP